VQDAILVLQDGKYFLGKSVGKKGKCIGELILTVASSFEKIPNNLALLLH
jgi:carbamoylphosphate synthase small subunit